MSKHKWALLLLLCTLICCAQSFSVFTWAADVYDYELKDDGTACIVQVNAEAETMSIPEEIDGYVVSEIDAAAFADCTLLQSVDIPAAVTAIADGAFLDCVSLTSINVSEENTVYGSIKGVLFYIPDLTLHTYPAGRTDQRYEIPNGITSIGALAFSSCSALSELLIPASTVEIDKTAFLQSIGLTEIEVSGENDVYSSIGGVLYNKQSKELCVYPAGKTEEQFEIPNGIKSIGENAFAGGTSLKQLTVPASVVSIEEAFEGCEDLELVVTHNSAAEAYAQGKEIACEYSDASDETSVEEASQDDAGIEDALEAKEITLTVRFVHDGLVYGYIDDVLCGVDPDTCEIEVKFPEGFHPYLSRVEADYDYLIGKDLNTSEGRVIYDTSGEKVCLWSELENDEYSIEDSMAVDIGYVILEERADRSKYYAMDIETKTLSSPVEKFTLPGDDSGETYFPGALYTLDYRWPYFWGGYYVLVLLDENYDMRIAAVYNISTNEVFYPTLTKPDGTMSDLPVITTYYFDQPGHALYFYYVDESSESYQVCLDLATGMTQLFSLREQNNYGSILAAEASADGLFELTLTDAQGVERKGILDIFSGRISMCQRSDLYSVFPVERRAEGIFCLVWENEDSDYKVGMLNEEGSFRFDPLEIVPVESQLLSGKSYIVGRDRNTRDMVFYDLDGNEIMRMNNAENYVYGDTTAICSVEEDDTETIYILDLEAGLAHELTLSPEMDPDVDLSNYTIEDVRVEGDFYIWDGSNSTALGESPDSVGVAKLMTDRSGIAAKTITLRTGDAISAGETASANQVTETSTEIDMETEAQSTEASVVEPLPESEMHLEVQTDEETEPDTEVQQDETETENRTADTISYHMPSTDEFVEDEETGIRYVDKELLIIFKQGTTESQIQNVVAAVNGSICGSIAGVNLYQIELNEQMTIGEIRQLRDDIMAVYDYVVYVTYDSVREYEEQSGYIPEDPFAGAFDSPAVSEAEWLNDVTDSYDTNKANWWLKAANVTAAWEHEDEFSEVLMGIVDSVVDVEHMDLNDETADHVSIYNPLNLDTQTAGDHGTHVAGIMGACRDNQTGIAGVASNCDILAVPFINDEASGFDMSDSVMLYDVFILVEEADKRHQPVVINLSLGGAGALSEEETSFSSEELQEQGNLAAALIGQLLQAEYDDFLIIQAAGNGYDNTYGTAIDAINNLGFCSVTENSISGWEDADIDIHDIMDHIIIVAAAELTDGKYQLTSFSDYGDQVSICAPGENIYSTVAAKQVYDYMSGTSMAAPIVTGVCALTWSANTSLTAAEVKRLVCETSTTVVNNNPEITADQGTYYMVDADAAVEGALEAKADYRLLSSLHWADTDSTYAESLRNSPWQNQEGLNEGVVASKRGDFDHDGVDELMYFELSNHDSSSGTVANVLEAVVCEYEDGSFKETARETVLEKSLLSGASKDKAYIAYTDGNFFACHTSCVTQGELAEYVEFTYQGGEIALGNHLFDPGYTSGIGLYDISEVSTDTYTSGVVLYEVDEDGSDVSTMFAPYATAVELYYNRYQVSLLTENTSSEKHIYIPKEYLICEISADMATDTDVQSYIYNRTKAVHHSSSILDELEGYTFVYASGAGGWSSGFTLGEHGTFTGDYADDEMGSTGADYPKGTVYLCNYSGTFTNPVKISEYVYSVQLINLETEEAEGTEHIRDGVRIISSVPFGLQDTTQMYLYLPGAAIADLPNCLPPYKHYEDLSDGLLPDYGLYSPSESAWFAGNPPQTTNELQSEAAVEEDNEIILEAEEDHPEA